MHFIWIEQHKKQLICLSPFPQNLFLKYSLSARELNSLVPEAHLYTCTTKFKSICIIKSYQAFPTKMKYVFSFSLPLSYCEE